MSAAPVQGRPALHDPDPAEGQPDAHVGPEADDDYRPKAA